jgi:N-alpha-acetyl-L-2,4-diaminobutyrate deacetylase
MTRVVVTPDKLDLVSPGRRDYWVALTHDSIWGDHLIPLTVVVGKRAEAGRGLVAFGANHGNEYEGPIALRHLMRELDTASVTGRLILVPVLNAAAFRAGTRDSTLDDGVNLNRAFVDGAGEAPALGRVTHRIARFVREAIWPHVHVVLDLHAGGEIARFAPLTSVHHDPDPGRMETIRETASWFGTPLVLVYGADTPGLLPTEAHNLGKIAVGCELGWGGAVQAEGVWYARQGVRAAAVLHGQMEADVEPIAHHLAETQRVVDMSDRASVTVAPFAGHYEPVLECGMMVRAGDTVGLIHDFERVDEPPWPVLAGISGVFVAQAWGARVRQGQHVAIVGRVIGGYGA